MNFLAPIAAWFAKKLGVVLGTAAFWLFQKIFLRVYEYVVTSVLTWWARRKRAKDQEEKQKKVEDDVQQGKPRDDESRKNEEDWLNS